MIIINDLIDTNLVKNNESRSTKFSRQSTRFWPTDCSCEVGGKVQGKCARELYYSLTNVKSTNPINSRGLRICDAGNMYEDKEIERAKAIGVYKDDGVRINFNIPNTDITVAGKVDIIYKVDDRVIGGEIKSGYGYMFQQNVFGSKTVPGLPMIKHLMQVMMYLYYYKYFNQEDGIDEFYIVYMDRGDCRTRQFGIRLSEDNYPVIDDGYITRTFKNVNMSNSDLFAQEFKNKRESNRETKIYSKFKDYEFRCEDIFERFKMISECVKEKRLPEKDFKYKYTMKEMEQKYKDGEISKVKLDNIKKKGDIQRDFQCAYCNYLQKCISDDTGIKFKEEPLMVKI